jgi:DNA-directed RNA polymerase specialized sigma24 family protein
MKKDRELYVGAEDLLVQLRIANRLLLAQVRPRMSQVDLILMLESSGAGYQELASLLGTTASTVSNALVRVRRRAEEKKTKALRKRPHIEEDGV